MPSVLSCGAYVPFRRLERAAIAAMLGGNATAGQRSVASYDEDTTTMGVEAARICLRSASDDSASPDMLWFSTTEPAYVDKTNATAIHAALRLDAACGAADANGAVRSAAGALRSALTGSDTTLVVGADIRTGLPNSSDEANGGDAAAAVLVGEGRGIAELIGLASITEEFTDRWRVPGEHRSRLWEDRFGEQAYAALAEQAWTSALKSAELTQADIGQVAVTGTHARAVSRIGTKLEAQNDLTPTVGLTGAASPGLTLTAMLENAGAGQVVALVVLADGADVFVLRTTDAISGFRPSRSVAAQIATGSALPYAKFLSWRGQLRVEGPNRPEPARPSSSAAARRREWKFGLVAGREPQTGEVMVPPAVGVDQLPEPLSDSIGTVASFTVDHLVYSPSPPVVFAVVDFEGGGRAPCELTDVDASEVKVGDRVEMTFRRLFTADGMANYFWKARPVRI